MSENAFGILVNRFCVLAKYIHLEPTKCTVITNACIAQHNFLLSKKDACYAATEGVEIWLIREATKTRVQHGTSEMNVVIILTQMAR